MDLPQLFKIFVIAFISFFSLNSYAFLKEKKAVPLKKAIQNTLDENRKKYHLPAISLSIKLPNSDQIQDYVSGYYSLSQNKNITPDTLFQIGSITKTFTATLIFKLIEENKLNSADNLAKWLPQYPRWKNITIDDLLHHTSGIYNYTSGALFDNLLRNHPQKQWSLNAVAKIAYEHADLFKPGTRYHYTNTDYILLGMLIEKATHHSLQQVFDSYLKQYDLNHTYYLLPHYPNILKNSIAQGYNRDGTFKFNADVTWVSLSFWQSAGGMLSTPHDLVKWLNDLFTRKIITNKSLEKMTSVFSEKNAKIININTISIPTTSNPSKPFAELGIGAGMGLIYFKNNGFTWVHAGGTPGYESLYAYSPCNGIYLALTYNIKPKQQLIFIQVADNIFRILNQSAHVIKVVKDYQKNNLLLDYCNKEAKINLSHPHD